MSLDISVRGGSTFDLAIDGPRLARQHELVFAYMRDGYWHSLASIAAATGFPEASISARLRDFRKPKFGAHTVERRRGGWGGCWEYKLVVTP